MPKKGVITGLYQDPPAKSVAVNLGEMGPEAAKSYPGQKLVRQTDGQQSAERALAQTIEHVLGLCQQQGRTALYAAISALEMPGEEALDEAWTRYGSELAQVVEAQGDLARYRQLEAEADGLAGAQEEGLKLSVEDVKTLTAYLTASRLFYNCLQLAYVPEKHGFEERIFWAPE